MEVMNKNIRLLMLVTLAGLVILTLASPSMAVISSKTYTSDADFDEGTLVGVEHKTVSDQLQLSEKAAIFPFIWIPNSNEGTVSKYDILTGKELGRYYTGPTSNGDPSRTTVDLNGNVWFGNRNTGTVVKIGLLENGQWIDKDGDGEADTSQDINGNGVIESGEILPWGQDECVLYEVLLGDSGSGPRGIAIDANNDVWAGTNSISGVNKFYHIDGDTGEIIGEDTILISPYNAYGAIIDSYGNIWCSCGPSVHQVIKIDPETKAITPVSLYYPPYGLGIDKNGHLFVSGHGTDLVSKIDVETNTVLKSAPQGDIYSRGVTVTDDGDVWIVNSQNGNLTRLDNELNFKATIDIGAGNWEATSTGAAVDSQGKVWTCNYNDGYLHRIDPETNLVDLSVQTPGISGSGIGMHYGYSDMTGIISRTVTTKIGAWTVNFDSEEADTSWGTVSWNANEPTGTSLKIEVRSSNDGNTWSSWETAANDIPLSSTPSGRYLQIKTTMQISSGDVSPVLYDLTIKVGNLPPVVNAGADLTVNEGDSVPFSGSFEDPNDAGAITFEWDFSDGNTASGTLTPSHTYADNGVDIVTLKVTDSFGEIGMDTLTVTVNNVDPVVGEINSPADPVKLGTMLTVDSTFTDPGVLDTHTAIWDWGDSSTSTGLVTETDGSGTVSGTHTYSSAAVYEIKLTVTDKDGGSDSSIFNYIVIYDPTGGFVTGGGWINSPEGAYVSDTTLAGTANFGFVSKYKKGATVPTGVTQFNFQVADLNFHSDTYDWLVIAGARAQYKGIGTINGEGEYGFMLTAVDGQLNGGGGSDKFRIKIWDKASGAIVYDNMLGADDNADLTTEIRGGSITIHKE
jgi:streptogramin lyase/PKD repeat protein